MNRSTQQHKNYRPAKPEVWSGRQVSKDSGVQYWYQAVQCVPVSDSDTVKSDGFGLLGYACDEGVKRNQGRIGAAGGPLALREKLGKLAWPHDGLKVYDFGDVLCPDSDMESS